jgi:6-phosphogluconolactonase (cycloisomerase 2 family)
LGYDPKRQGNFLIPADQKSNNTRVFAVSSAVKSVRQMFDHLIEETP